MKKIDIHVHARLPERAGEGAFHSSDAIKMMNYLKEKQIVHGIIMSMGESKAPDNMECAEICKIEKRLSWNCNFDARNPDSIFERMAVYKEMGAVGVGELCINERMDSPILQAIFASAEKLELPVLFHMSPEVGFNYGIVDDPGLPLLEDTLKKYPNLKLIGHSQPFWIEISKDAPTDVEGRNERGKGAVILGGRVVELMRKYPNLYADLSAGSGFCAITRDEDFGLQFLKEFSNQLLFGTDTVSSESPWQSPLWKWLEEKYEQGKLTEHTIRKICYENAEKLYGISLHDNENTVMVQTPCGTVRGIKEKERCSYLGIPYASAERFMYPKVTIKWDGILDATQFGSCSYQFRSFQSEKLGQDSFYYHEFRENLHFRYGEDCQRLNIWTPEKIEKPCPVIIFIHGGAFLGGSSNEKHLIAPKWTEQGVIAVTINYRLGPFGFLCTSDGMREAGHTGNYGLYDQLAAIQWIHENIASFGGDPNRITLMGQSAGAMCVHKLCASPLVKGLIQRAVMLSGAGLSPIFESDVRAEENTDFGDTVLKTAGCTTLEEFRKVSAWKIQQAFAEQLGKTDRGLAVISPVIDDKIVVASTSESMRQNKFYKIPYMMCSTSEDLWQPELFYSILKWQDAQIENKNTDCYSAFFSRKLPGDNKGAFHSADLWYWCNTLDQSWRPFTKLDKNLAQMMVQYLTNFAKNGNPNGEDLPKWNTRQNANGMTMKFGDDGVGQANIVIKETIPQDAK